MKHADGDRGAVERVLAWLKWPTPLSSTQWDNLGNFVAWLNDEAEKAGGIGPRERGRIWARHIADSLSFAGGWPDGPPEDVLDVGAGVGLPGIPLAIIWPQTRVILLDRSGRRADLARRAVRRLKLENVEIRQGDVLAEPPEWDNVVLRAVFPLVRAREVAEGLLTPTGRAVVGVRGRKPRLPYPGAEVLERSMRIVDVPATVLDGTVSLLIMGPSEH